MILRLALLFVLLLPAAGRAQAPPADTGLRQEIEPRATALLAEFGRTLADAKSFSFTALTSYESVARTGLPLTYTTLSQVLVRRPDGLRVLTAGDGPPLQFFYDGRTATAFSPEQGLAAVADAPPTIDAMLRFIYDRAAMYFPFADVLVAQPWGDMKDDLKLAFVVGQSKVVGGVTTDIVVVAGPHVHMQIWLGAQDHLPRRITAIFPEEPGQYRHSVEFSGWQIDPVVPPDAFRPDGAVGAAPRVAFARPDAGVKR